MSGSQGGLAKWKCGGKCSVNTDGHEVGRRRVDVKEAEDAPGYASELRAARGRKGFLIVIRNEGKGRLRKHGAFGSGCDENMHRSSFPKWLLGSRVIFVFNVLLLCL